MVCCSANWASGWWTACIDCSDEPFFWCTDRKIERDGERRRVEKNSVKIRE